MVKKIMFSCLLLLTPWCVVATRAQSTSADWQIVAQAIDPANYYGITVANGMIGLVSSPEPMKVKDVVLNGAFDTYGRGRVSNILKVFNFVNMNLDVDGQRIGQKSISNYRQTLDMQKAVLTTTFDYQDKVSVQQQVMALRHLPYSTLTMVEITAKKDCEIIPMSVIETPENLKEVKNFYAEIDREHVTIRLLTSVAKSPSGKHTVAASNSFIFNEPHGQEPDVIHEDWDYNMHLAKFKKKLKAGETYKFSVVGSVSSTAHTADPHNEAERLTLFAALERTERLLMRHNAEWVKLWQSDIVIDGDPDAQRAVRSALYHLYSFVREGTGYSLSPMGLSGLGYNGHVFWDTELWMYPPILMLKPEIARSILEYRFERMAMAKQNAFSHGYAGVMFPWESDADGQEATPVWALTGPFQHHITGCVGWAFWKYYQVTKDKEWLRTRGYPMLKEVADFWASRVEREVGPAGQPGKYHINNVIGANEWQENIDDNAFTNGMAKTSLQYASQAAQELGLTPNPDWKVVADNIPILKFPDGTTRENRTYSGVMIKQADVNLLAYPLTIVTGEAAIRKDLIYYEPKYSPEGPAMGWSALATLNARLGDTDKAYNWFVKSYKPNEVPPFGVLAETAGGTNPYFATGAGGMLQAVLNGFGGLDINDAGITQLKTKLPKKWKSLTIKGVGIQRKTVQIQ
ncbi:trehalose/maltose hydrolase-like putative phosphorylase [Spirosoma sp. LMG 31448]|uniref:Trehalose/maltose hydrolase-like putative phosphorylase n=2 Tax=Spirosoma utsteinense TaxID=2585773 RepID=A0ABR6W793_9BACT|nr:trehalose/maltose hydrolase-like putative phosphorylase [Spirosoma utsteinense]MBC3792457.1 trehalose/maltose hydrolase-like putative phosphorylase [Spirosoma utsteinense]